MNKELNEVISILNNIGETPSRNDKEKILKDNRDNALLKRVLFYTYTPYKIYGVGKKSLSDVSEFDDVKEERIELDSIFDMLDYLTTHNLNSDIKDTLIHFLNSQSLQIREFIVKMILKDLRLGVTAKSINKTIKGLIPEFNLMLGKKYEDRADKILNEKIIITIKLDGYRLAIIKDDNDVKCMTRQGKVLEGLIDIEDDMLSLPNGVYDGELLATNEENLDSKELFTKTRKLASKKGNKQGLVFNVFDYLPIDEFQRGKSDLNCIDRKKTITNILCKHSPKWIKEVDILEITDDHSRIKHWLDKAIADGNEGCMINLDKPYECKRSNTLLKVKQFYTMDLRICGFEEGEGRLTNTLGAMLVEYKDDNIIKIGSGFSDIERKDIWENQDKYIGKIVEMNYFEETVNDKGGQSVRFPTYSAIRLDKDEPSFH